MLGIIIDLDQGRTIEDTDKGPIVIWGACLIPVGRFDKHGETGYIVDVVTVLDPGSVRHGLILMAQDTVGSRFMAWCAQNGLPQPDSKNVRKIINGLVADPESSTEATYVDSVGEVEHGLWALSNGVMVDGEFIPMERGQHRQTSTGRRVVYAPSISCDETCGSGPMRDGDKTAIREWATGLVDMFSSMAPIISAAWVRASVMRSRIEAMDAQLPAMYICGDSHRGKTLMATVTTRMLGAKGERPHANMTSSSNAGVFLAASARSSLPFIMDEVKPYSGVNDNDLVKSLVNGDIPAKSTRSGRLRSSTRIKSMPMLVSEFVPGDTSSITNRVFTMNLVSLSAHAKTDKISRWVWGNDKFQPLYDRWSYSIYHSASTMKDEEFAALWSECNDDAVTICHDACMTLNRSITATTIALLGFKLINGDSGGKLTDMYKEFSDALSTCLRDMSRLVTDVSAIGRFITSLKSGWSAMEGRYSKLVCDRVFTYSSERGIIIDHVTLHGVLIDSRRIDASRLGNPATVAMVLESEGFKPITNDKILRGRYSMPIATFLKKEWAYEMSRLMRIMDCTCGNIVCNSVDNSQQED
jgi:hypothetical protein